jgi:hypothetical protein
MDTRTEPRKSAKDNVIATILGNPDVAVPCDINNFSQSGICITLQREIPTGSAVKVDWDEHFLLGRVKHVASQGSAYRIGLELLYCSKWNGPMPVGAEVQ